jgi:hypothetical protein
MISCSRLGKLSNEFILFCMASVFPNLFFVFDNLNPIWLKIKEGRQLPPLLGVLREVGRLGVAAPPTRGC